jgi:hypothetical protein
LKTDFHYCYTASDVHPARGRVTASRRDRSASTVSAASAAACSSSACARHEVRITNVAPLGDPLEIEVRGGRLSIRRDEAAQIRVRR